MVVLTKVGNKVRRQVLSMIMALPLLSALAASPQPAAAQPVILVVGDSISAEYGLARGSGWVALLSTQVSSHTIVNASISGETTAGGLTRLAALLAKHEPSIVILELGANDALRGMALSSTRQNLASMIDQSKAKKVQVLLLGMQLPPNYGQYAKTFAGLYAELAKEKKVALVPFLLEGIAQDIRYFQSDRIHPTAQAQPKLLANVLPELQKLLRKPG
jgi:acyl-CoA thioesterase I